MKKILMSLLLSIAALLLPAGPVVDGNGNLQIGKLALRWSCYSLVWSDAVLGYDSFKAAPGFPRYNSGEFETAGTWNGFRFTVTAAAVKEDTLTYSARFKANPPVETRTLALVMNLPADTPAPGVLVDGRKIELPATFERIQLFGSRKVHCLQFELDGRTVTIEGDFTLLIQDDRKWRNNHFVFRLGADPVSGTLKEASLDLRLRVASPRTVAVDLKPAFNMGFRDEKLNDGKGGWTDQGPRNDLAAMTTGMQTLAGIRYDVIAPAENSGRSCIVLADPKFRRYPASAPVQLRGKAPGEWL